MKKRTERFRSILTDGMAAGGMDCPSDVLDKFIKYYNMLIEENKKNNLTAIKDDAEVAEKHFIDSLLLWQAAGENAGVQVVDIGSGAGFPGLPIKIYHPRLQVCLVEAIRKKVLFMEKVIKSLRLKGAHAIWTRVEDFAADNREKFTTAMARAVAELRVLVEYALPLVSRGGILLAAKGPGVQKEVEEARRAIEIMGGEIYAVKRYQLPLSKEERSAVIIIKTRHTPDKYPRRAGRPKKRPL